MPVGVNTNQWRATAASLKTLERPVNLALRRGLRAEGRPLGERIVRAIADGMPSRGGLAERIRSGGRVTLSITQSSVRLSLANRTGMFMGQFESGSIRHPTYGRDPWVAQAVPGGRGGAEFSLGADALRDRVSKLVAEAIAGGIK